MNSIMGNMINGSGIADYGLDTELSKLSGGQRAKVYLAKLLLEAPDGLLMDEPTNFVDVTHIEWLG
jgi:ATPase subunit of ABC transporter with duplicated ATPase domains